MSGGPPGSAPASSAVVRPRTTATAPDSSRRRSPCAERPLAARSSRSSSWPASSSRVSAVRCRAPSRAGVSGPRRSVRPGGVTPTTCTRYETRSQPLRRYRSAAGVWRPPPSRSPASSPELALSGLGGRPAGVRELVLAHDLERAGGRAHERQRAGERGEVVLLDAPRDGEQVGRDGRHVQDVAQRQDAALVSGRVPQLQHDADDGLRAQRDGDQGAGRDPADELARDFVVEGLREGSRADEREDGGVAHATPPSCRRRRIRR